MRHKATAAAGALAVSALLVLTGCSGTDAPTEPVNPDEVSGTVTFWAYPLGGVKEPAWWEDHIEKFNKTYPNVKIDLQMQGFAGRKEALVTALSGGTEPDVVYLNPDYIPGFVEEDVLLPLDDLRDDWDKFHQTVLDEVSFNDKIYGAPQLVSVDMPFCDARVLEAAGGVDCPTTWDELREIAPAVKESGNYVTNYYGTLGANLTFYPFLWQAGGEVINADGTAAAFNGPEGLKALEFIKEMVDNKWVPYEELSVLPAFEQSEAGKGKVAYRGGGTIASRRSIQGEAIQVGDVMSESEKVVSGTVGAWSIFNTTESPEASKAWVKYLTDVEFLDEFLPQAQYLSPRTDTAPLFEDDPALAVGAENIEYLRTTLRHPKALQISDILVPHIQKVLMEGADPQKELDAAADEVNRIL